ncbi:alpha/beta hydrolase [Amycolatopsis rubida]|uniref:Alpha/beta hydrolase n=1 Tax=Amycolatopsis rubida TaxID=112413 RepID=A0ABX0C5F0_9PSEU|nr:MULTISPECIES: alpha/beta hydrolase [Amycolatopsis]MYW95232.1 alpha/beta hydrolase fold domain-containing protein [Amycolatopsis rubida]NEC60220.1 alpha/beta hydrolase [Amycolatopsis rubida]OAP28371.1 Carboxylesterase NlhH [Amycolatopsis sp. M39]
MKNAGTAIPRPPFDPELEAALESLAAQLPPTITPEMIHPLRQTMGDGADARQALVRRGLEVRDVTAPSSDGGAIPLSIVQPAGHVGAGVGFYYVHGGGMVFGDRLGGVEVLADWLLRYDAVAVSVGYRLAPEHPDPAPVEDCYAGLVWTAEHAEELGIDAGRLVIAGSSAGGGLAAGTTLLARDRCGPALAGQLLMYPMLDDRDDTASTRQIDGVGVWDRGSNRTGWSALLGDRRGSDEVSVYAAPARAGDLSGLPPTFIDCGSAEVFRDEDIAYASGIWAAGGQAELHVWPGGFHAFDAFAPHTTLAKDMTGARDQWIDRLLS